MNTVLVIDDDPAVGLSIRLAVPDWTVLGAANGLDGLELTRRHLTELDLIVLDIHMSGLDGYWTSLQIRSLSRTISILPFTGAMEAVPFLNELGCAPALFKPVRPDVLATELQRAIDLQPSFAPSAVLEFMQKQAAAAERIARQHYATMRVALMASSRVTSIGLHGLLTAAGAHVLLEAANAETLYQSLRGMCITTLVAAASDYAEAITAAREHTIPLVLIASTLAEGLVVADLPEETIPIGVVVATDDAAPQTLARVLQTVTTGKRFIVPELTAPFVGSPLSPQEQALVALDVQARPTRESAQRLGVEPDTIHHYRTRICRKLGLQGTSEVRQWAEQWWRDRGCAS